MVECIENYDLKPHTTFKIGGFAKKVYFPKTEEIRYEREHGSVAESWIRIDYKKDGEVLDVVKLYDFKTYAQALDSIMNYVQNVLNNGVKEEELPKYDEQLVKNLKLMHNVMTSMNNEDAYFSWIYVCPDEPSEDDFIYIASNEDEYKDCEGTFYRLFEKYAKDGLYRPTEEEKQFAFDACKKLGIPQIEVLN